MSALRVLQCVSTMNHGGAEHFIMNIYRKINKKAIQFDFMYRVPYKCAFDDEIESMGGRIFRVVDPDRHPVTSRISYQSFFLQHPEIQAVHEHRTSCAGFFGLLKEARNSGVPLRILHAHSSNNVFSKNPVKTVTAAFNAYFLNRYANRYIACSDLAANHLYGNCDSALAQAIIIKNAIDLDSFAYNSFVRQETREQYGIRPETIVIGHVGRFAPEKNQIMLVDILQRANHKGINAELLLVGDGPTKDLVRNKAESVGVIDKVHFVGLQDDATPFYSAMDVFCMPSFFEGLPVVCVEAQANGLPMVLSETITRQVDISGTTSFISLGDSIDTWSEVVVQRARAGRADCRQAMIASGYDAADIAEWFEGFYLSGSTK